MLGVLQAGVSEGNVCYRETQKLKEGVFILDYFLALTGALLYIYLEKRCMLRRCCRLGRSDGCAHTYTTLLETAVWLHLGSCCLPRACPFECLFLCFESANQLWKL